ncbi:MAG: helix-turn-helix transcriptional regulator [Aristaeellaceae bacterium]
MSRPYLSARFKKESGETLTDFILKEKTEEVKRLLRYSDKSLSTIGAYLGFSSPGHFAHVFRKYARMPPHRIPRPIRPVRPGDRVRKVIFCWLRSLLGQCCTERIHRYYMYRSGGR